MSLMQLLLRMTAAAGLFTLGFACAKGPSNDRGQVEGEVRAREMAFAKTMADRDGGAFASFVSVEAVFVGRATLRGRQQVADGWKRFFEGAQPPFSWRPETVEALDSGTLALTSGPVLDPEGKQIGTFNSVWRRESDGRWRVIFDKGCP
jgi:ketosteroid isomerase-like protein